MGHTEPIGVQRVGAVWRVGIDDPETRNALTDAVLERLSSIFAEADADPDVRCLVLTGSDSVFASGADLGALAERDVPEIYFGTRARLWEGLQGVQTPTVAAVAGHCLGGGLELAMYADLIVAAESARFGLPETRLGLTPGAGGTLLLSRRVGQSVAMEMILAGRILNAEEAASLGLVARVAAAGNGEELAMEIAAKIAARPALAQRLARESVRHALGLDELRGGILAERRGFAIAFESEDGKEGVDAFLEKRAPTWSQDS